MNITRIAHEKLLAAAAHAKAETARAEAAHRALLAIDAKYEDLKKSHEDALAQNMTLRGKVETRDEALVQLALRLSFHGDAEPIAGTE
jgi:hypothetical protein